MMMIRNKIIAVWLVMITLWIGVPNLYAEEVAEDETYKTQGYYQEKLREAEQSVNTIQAFEKLINLAHKAEREGRYGKAEGYFMKARKMTNNPDFFGQRGFVAEQLFHISVKRRQKTRAEFFIKEAHEFGYADDSNYYNNLLKL